MKKSKLSDAKIFEILRAGASGMTVEDLTRTYGIGKTTYYKLKNQYGGMDKSDLVKLRKLEEENKRLKKMYADLSMDHDILKDVIEKKLQGRLNDES
jgi:putative transposase